MQVDERKMSLGWLAWPIFLEMFLQFLLGATDTFMVSHISDEAVGVVGISTQLFGSVNIIFMAIASGAGIVIGQKLGAKRPEDARRVALMGLVICALFGIVISVGLAVFAEPIARLLQLPEHMVQLGKNYIAIVGGGSIFLATMGALSAAIRSTGDTQRPMMVAIGINIFHVALNYVFIYGAFGMPQWGLEGVALSTVLSRILGTLMLAIIFIKLYGRSEQKIYDKPLLKETLDNAWPLGVGYFSWTASQLVIFSFIAQIGSDELIARTYMNTLESFCFTIGFAIALAVKIRVAYYYGAGEIELVRRSAYQAVWIGLAFVMFNTFLLYLFGEQVLKLFTKDPHIVAIGVSLLLINIALQPSKMVNMAMSQSLNGVGEARFIMLTGLTSMWWVAAGLSYVFGLSLGWGLYGIYAAMILDETIRGVWSVWKWRRKFHLLKQTS